MRAKWTSLLLVASIAAVAIGSCTSTRGRLSTPVVDLLLVDTGTRVMGVRAPGGSMAFASSAGLAMPGQSELVSTRQEGTSTMLSTLDPFTGRAISTLRLDGRLAAHVIAGDGERVALMPETPGAVTEPPAPVGRSFTRIVVAHPDGGAPAERYRLRGNFEPEAFSSNGDRLFLIRHVPPEAPSAYRVASLDLGSGRVRDVVGRYKTPPETMAGTRLNQIFDPAGDRLYTLYTSQPAAYAGGAADADGGAYSEGTGYAGGGVAWSGGSRPVAFVHVLDLERRWAFCAELPGIFGPGPADAKAIAVSPDGASVYAIDASHGRIAVVDTRSLEVTTSARVDLTALGTGPTVARVSPDGRTLFIGRDGRIVRVGTDAFEASEPWSLSAPLTGMAVSQDGRRLYVGQVGRIEQLDATTGGRQAVLPAPGLTSFATIEAVAA
jgi:hypothetical protein